MCDMKRVNPATNASAVASNCGVFFPPPPDTCSLASSTKKARKVTEADEAEMELNFVASFQGRRKVPMKHIKMDKEVYNETKTMEEKDLCELIEKHSKEVQRLKQMYKQAQSKLTAMRYRRYRQQLKYMQQNGATVDEMYELWKSNGIKKNHYDVPVDIKPPGYPDFWVRFPPANKGGVCDLSYLEESLLNADDIEKEEEEAYLLEIMKMNFGSCEFDW